VIERNNMNFITPEYINESIEKNKIVDDKYFIKYEVNKYKLKILKKLKEIFKNKTAFIATYQKDSHEQIYDNLIFMGAKVTM
jgi:hypothetical protein